MNILVLEYMAKNPNHNFSTGISGQHYNLVLQGLTYLPDKELPQRIFLLMNSSLAKTINEKVLLLLNVIWPHATVYGNNGVYATVKYRSTI